MGLIGGTSPAHHSQQLQKAAPHIAEGTLDWPVELIDTDEFPARRLETAVKNDVD